MDACLNVVLGTTAACAAPVLASASPVPWSRLQQLTSSFWKTASREGAHICCPSSFSLGETFDRSVVNPVAFPNIVGRVPEACWLGTEDSGAFGAARELAAVQGTGGQGTDEELEARAPVVAGAEAKE